MRIIRPPQMRYADLLISNVEILLQTCDIMSDPGIVIKPYRYRQAVGYSLGCLSTAQQCIIFGNSNAEQVSVVLGSTSQFSEDTGAAKVPLTHYHFALDEMTSAAKIVLEWLLNGSAP